ncbi:MAG: hypothetical protein OHK0046_46650 [Anaerolineae bacterium]
MDAILDILRFLHSWMRWLVLIAAVVVILFSAMGMNQNRPFEAYGVRIMRIFAIVISLQWLIGLIFLIAWGAETGFGVRYYWEHLFTMTLAVGLASATRPLYKRMNLGDRGRYRANIIVVLVVLLLIIGGIAVLPDGIQWRFYTP